MDSYREALSEAGEKEVAIGHFNISNVAAFWAVVESANELSVPVIIGASEGERDYIGIEEVVALIKTANEDSSVPLFLNADHTYSFERVKEAIDAGFDSVIFDGAKLSLEENTKITKKCVDYARASGSDVLVEAEMGYIGKSSAVLDELPEGVGVTLEEATKSEEAKQFVESTGIDLFAPSVGNVHGMLRKVANPELHIERIKEIREATGVPLVLHGGSGIKDDNFTVAIKAGIRIIHISTEMRRAWYESTRKHMEEKPEDIAPYKVGKDAKEAIKAVVTSRLKLFNHFI